jgi:hypothetical protein
MAAITTCCLLVIVEESQAILLHAVFRTEYSVSQGPDLNRSVVDLQSTAWPLRHLGSRVVGYPIFFGQDTL